jgi:NADH:ubiquinone oxidoreductase subunit B-like Fe-S oxidoreductase
MGACASIGGIFDSDAIFHAIGPVSLYVPG